MADVGNCTVIYNEVPSVVKDEMFMEDLEKRKLFLDGEIDEETFRQIGYYILKINEEDNSVPAEKRKPIKLYISCYGGSVIAGLTLINIIKSSITPVYTIVVGQAYSMAFYIGIIGTKRFSFPDSTYLIHDGGLGIQTSTSKVRDYVAFDDQINKKLQALVAEHTNLTTDELEEKSRIEWYLFADEAKEKGIVDCIIGEDCSLEEVF